MYKCCILCCFQINVLHIFYTNYLLRFINLEYNKSDKSHVVSQMAHAKNIGEQWRSEGNWRPGANLNFAPPPLKEKS